MSEECENSQETVSQVEETTNEPITKKDPRRVEQGKKLVMISREAKERKMREKIEAEMRKEEKK